MVKQETIPTPLFIRWTEKNWLLIPLALMIVMAAVMLEATLLYRTVTIPPLPLQQIADVSLVGGPSRFDYQSLDAQRGLLFVAHSDANTVTVFSITSNRVITDIANIPHVHGVLVIPELGRVYATATENNLVYVIDERTYRIIAKIAVGVAPDGLAYDPVDHKVFVSDEAGKNDAVIDTRTEKRTALIALGGEAGNTQYDAGSHRLFVNVQTLNQLVAINPITDQIVAHYPLPGCDTNHGLNIDVVQRLAFIACTGNAKLLMVDMRSMKVVSEQTVGANPDVLALDSAWHLLYVASESGVLSVFDEHGRTLKKLDEGFIANNAHSVAVDQKLHRIYMPLENVGGRAVMRVALFNMVTP